MGTTKISWEYMRQRGYLGVYKLKEDKLYTYCSAGKWKSRIQEPYRKDSYVKVVKYSPHDGGQFELENGIWFKQSMLEPLGCLSACLKKM